MDSGGEARKRGRPKGSTNRRAKDLQGFIAAKYGASAAQQSAALCMVTPSELRAAGGSMARAMVAKAQGLTDLVRAQQDLRDEGLRDVVRQALADLVDGRRDAEAKEVRELVTGFIHRVKETTAGFGLVQALKLMADERAQLLPYTDQRQPLAIEAKDSRAQPSVVLMGAAPVAQAMGLEKTEVFEGVFEEVSPAKSHGEGQPVEQLTFLGAQTAD